MESPGLELAEPRASSICPDAPNEDSTPSLTETETASEEQVDGPTSGRRHPLRIRKVKNYEDYIMQVKGHTKPGFI